MGGVSKAGHSSQPQYQGPYPVHLQDNTLQPTWRVRTQAVLWTPTFSLQCCGRHQLPYQTNTVRLPHMPLGINNVMGAGIYHTRRTW